MHVVIRPATGPAARCTYVIRRLSGPFMLDQDALWAPCSGLGTGCRLEARFTVRRPQFRKLQPLHMRALKTSVHTAIVEEYQAPRCCAL